MDETYDVIVLGTGLKECILSGLLSVDGKKVLHLDRNIYYGGASASLQLKTLSELPLASGTPITDFKDNNKYNVDIVPKFIMASGKLVQVLLHTDVVRYLDFKSIADTYVYRAGKIHHVPNTDAEAIKSPLMSLFEKRRCQKFFMFAEAYDEAKPDTHKGYDLHKMTMAELYGKFGLEPDTIDFIGHAMCMYRDDEYLTKPAIEAVKKMQLYFDSLTRFGKSSFIYPLYGLGELPQAFARLSAIYGGTYILNTSVEGIVYDESGKVSGVRISRPDDNGEHHLAKCSCIVTDPYYVPDKVRVTGKVVRAICIMNHPVPNTNNSESLQIIIPQKQIGRKSDVYITVTSSANQVSLQASTSLSALLLSSLIPATPSASSTLLSSSSAPQSRSSSLSATPWSPCRTAPRTSSSSPRATTRHPTSRPPSTTSSTCTAASQARNSSSSLRNTRTLMAPRNSFLVPSLFLLLLFFTLFAHIPTYTYIYTYTNYLIPQPILYLIY